MIARPLQVIAGESVRIGIIGNLATENRSMLKAFVLEYLHAGQRSFVIDFRECPYIDATGLGVLVSLRKSIDRAGGELVIENLNEDLALLFKLTRLDTLFTLRTTAAA